ncbi:MAG: helix-turn-helix domain-containing protein [Treponemataceae bacterium]|nr:helix-turn-helix domain-containing protein [Treponemataceae bacterium]
MGFAENLRNELDYQDIEIKELSQKTGISKNTLDKYLSGRKSQPGVENAVKIAQALGVSVEYLVCNPSNSKSEVLTLNKEQQNILKQYNALDNFNKQTIQDLLKSLSLRQK